MISGMYTMYPCRLLVQRKGASRKVLVVPERSGIIYSGLVELVVNAMVDVIGSYIRWE